MELERVRFSVVPERPYSLALTAQRYTRFPEVVDRFDGRFYRRFLPVGRRGALLSVQQVGTPARAILNATLDGPQAGSPAARLAAERIIHVSLGAAQPVTPFYRAFGADPVIGAAIRDFSGLRGAGVPSLWEALVTAILAQQVNLLFAYDIRRELAETFGQRARFGTERFIAFPTPASMAGEAPATLEKAEIVVVDGKQQYRYMRALPVQSLCLHCHGVPEPLTPAVRQKLRELYPDDKATGYKPGDIRGAMTIRKPV